MWQVIGWIIWGIAAFLAILGVFSCRRKAKSGEGFEPTAATGISTLSLWAISTLFLVFGWNRLHIIWTAPIALFVIPRLIAKEIPVVSRILVYAVGAFLWIVLAGIELKSPVENDEENEAQRARKKRIERYKRIRETARELTGKIMKHVPKFALTRAARELEMVGRKGILVFDSEEETNFLMDRCFYDIYWQGKNLIGHFIESDDYRELIEEEQSIVQGMSTAYYSLFEITDVDLSEATIEMHDLLDDRTYTVTDLSLSITAQEGYLLATRIKRVEGIYMMTGAVCPFEAEQKGALLEGLKSRKVAARKGKRRRKSLELQRLDYSAYFFRQHKRIGGIEFRTMDELE